MLIYLIRRFNDDIFTLKVGLAEQVFKVHKNLLRLSPVLACMTTGFFSEGINKEIALPEDDADSFGRIIEHLYGNNDATFDVDSLDLDGAEKLADMYGLAEKYQLPDFQDLVIQKLKQLDLLKEDRMTFFHIARQICQLTRESDEIFGAYFTHQAAKHITGMSKQELNELSDMVYLGGPFARKICKLQGAISHESRLLWLTYQASLLGRVVAAEQELRQQIERTTADLAKNKRVHKAQHPSCYQCRALL